MNPKFILVSVAAKPLVGTFVYGMVGQHRELVEWFEERCGYCRVHGGGWYEKDDVHKTMTLYGSSGDYGAPQLAFLNRIPEELRGYKFIWSPSWGLPGNELPLDDVVWF